MPRWWLALVLAGCASPRHDGSRVEVRSGDCVVCHRADALAVVDPPHAGAFPETCSDCHETTAWRPAFGGLHPEERFAVRAGAHAGVACAECHDRARGAYAAGANTVCALCHTGAHDRRIVDPQHQGIEGYAFDAARPGFCLSCHPDGTAFHHEERFPIRSGPHEPFACLDCHDPDRGPYRAGENTDCVGCHTGRHAQAVVDAQHREERDYVFDPANPHFCLRCHPRGRE
jgi:hypothetical protein